jgi:hypothetical protein
MNYSLMNNYSIVTLVSIILLTLIVEEVKALIVGHKQFWTVLVSCDCFHKLRVWVLIWVEAVSLLVRIEMVLQYTFSTENPSSLPLFLPRALCILSKHSTTEQYHQPYYHSSSYFLDDPVSALGTFKGPYRKLALLWVVINHTFWSFVLTVSM